MFEEFKKAAENGFQGAEIPIPTPKKPSRDFLKKLPKIVLIAVIVLVLLAVVASSWYTVNDKEQAVVTTFGKVTDITDADYSAQFDNEGARWDYYKALSTGVSNLNAQGMFKIWNIYPILTRYAINAPTTAQYVFGRSANLGYAYSMYLVSASGYCNSYNANSGLRCLPACVIGAEKGKNE